MNTFTVFVHDTVAVSDESLIGVIFGLSFAPSEVNEAVMAVAEYRKLLNDYESSDEAIEQRIRYIEALSRCIIKSELNNYYVGKNTI